MPHKSDYEDNTKAEGKKHRKKLAKKGRTKLASGDSKKNSRLIKMGNTSINGSKIKNSRIRLWNIGT